MNRPLLWIWLVCCVLLSGCHVAQKGYETMRKAGTDAMTLSRYHYDFTIVTAKTLNPSKQATALTTHVQIYQLADKSRFEQASYYDLLNQADKILDKDLLQQQSITLTPFNTQQVNGDIDQKSQYIGLVFFFNQPEDNEHSWKLLLPLNDVHLWGDNYILAEGNTAKLVPKKAVKALIKEQKAIQKAQEKAAKAQKKAEKAAKKEAQKAAPSVTTPEKKSK